jgi:hypothetical protein
MMAFNFGMPFFGLVGGIIAILFGILILAFPRILNYLIGIALILGGISAIAAGSVWMGLISLVFGIIILIFPRILNYLLGAYLIIIGLIFIFTTGFAPFMVVAGILLFLFGLIILVNPSIVNVIIAIALIIQGIIQIGQYYNWF